MIRYWSRPAAVGSEHLPPFVFVHGIGVGPAPYASFLDELGDASGAAVVAVELAEFAQRLAPPWRSASGPPKPREFANLVTTMLTKHGHNSAHFVGHSLGTAFVSYVAQHAPDTVASVAFIDPICVGMHDARVTRAFCSTPADSVKHETDNFFFKTELRTSAVVARHLWWYEAATWLHDVRPHTPTLVALSTEDEIVPVDAIRKTWGGQEARQRGVSLHEMQDIGHGGWLADEAMRQRLVHAALSHSASSARAGELAPRTSAR